jgi:hypothetical protein
MIHVYCYDVTDADSVPVVRNHEGSKKFVIFHVKLEPCCQIGVFACLGVIAADINAVAINMLRTISEGFKNVLISNPKQY